MGVWLPVESVACLSFCDNVYVTAFCLILFIPMILVGGDVGRASSAKRSAQMIA